MNLEDHGFSSQEQMTASIKPFAEHAGIMRKQLINQGWSRNGAEKLATEIIMNSLTSNNLNETMKNVFKRQ